MSVSLSSLIVFLLVSTGSNAASRPYVTNLPDEVIPEQAPFAIRIFLTPEHNEINIAWVCRIPNDIEGSLTDYKKNISIQIWFNSSATEVDGNMTRVGEDRTEISTEPDTIPEVHGLHVMYANTTVTLREDRNVSYAITCGNTTTGPYQIRYQYWEEGQEKDSWGIAMAGSFGRFNSTLISLGVIEQVANNLGNVLLAVPGGIVADHSLTDPSLKLPEDKQVTWVDWINWMITAQNVLTIIPIVASPSELDIAPFTNHSYALSPYKKLIDIPIVSTHKLDETLWYSFNHRNLHVVAICSFCDISDNSPQYRWLEADLAASNKTRGIHWTMIMGHEPIYKESVSYDNNKLSQLRKQIDKVLSKYKVDFAVWSHERWYERSFPLKPNLEIARKSYSSFLDNLEGTLHYTCGVGGIELQVYNMGKYDHSAFFDSRYYGTCLFKRIADDSYESMFVHNQNNRTGKLRNSDILVIDKVISKTPPKEGSHFVRFMKVFAIVLVVGAVLIVIAILAIRYIKKRDPTYIENKIRNVRCRFSGNSNPSIMHVNLENEVETPAPEQVRLRREA